MTPKKSSNSKTMDNNNRSTMSQAEQTINTIRTLAMDAVQAANSGHPGTPMALAPAAYQLWAGHLNYDPDHPHWPNRDRFVLSCGHASMLLYAVLHLAGVKHVDQDGQATGELAVSLEDIKSFRQWGSRTPGHPEFRHTTGVETTTGPLGQGCGNSVGMAIAGKWLAARYNRPDFTLFDYDVYAFCSDGDLMEGVACEAASLAAHLRLDNLCWVYDDNRITIEGKTDLAFSEDVAARFEGLGWDVVRVEDANDLSALQSAFDAFRGNSGKPTLISLRSVIGFGAPHKAGTAAAHGSPLGEEEIRLTKEAYGWPTEPPFAVPTEVPAHFYAQISGRAAPHWVAWNEKLQQYTTTHPSLAAELACLESHKLPPGWEQGLPAFAASQKGLATRTSSGEVLNAIAPRVPWLIGGSADLAPSTNTLVKDGADFEADNYLGRNLRFGIREHAMAAAANGMAECGLRPYAATFFVFSDYLRPAMRLAAMMGLPVIYVLTHDSIGLGEDGPTHQPVEHLSAVRAIPNLILLRPADANEVCVAWQVAMQQTHRPVALVLTRQSVPTLPRDEFAAAAGVRRGGYVLADAAGGDLPELILMASGSEVSIAVDAYRQLAADGVRCRLVSMASMELFAEQDASYRESVLPAAITARVAVEAGLRQSWDRYLGMQGCFVGLDDFGASAPYETIYQKRGITSQHVVAVGKSLL